MAMIESHYEVNVSLNGKHLFATDKRSCITESETRKVYNIIKSRFPESEGFEIEVTGINCSGRIMTTQFEQYRLMGVL